MADQTHERPHSGRGRLKNMHWSPHVVLFAAICLTASTLAVAQPNDGRCILIDVMQHSTTSAQWQPLHPSTTLLRSS
jgi:hypothetical protein